MYANDANDANTANKLLKGFHGSFFTVAIAAQRNQIVHVVGAAVFQAHDVINFVPRRQLAVAMAALPRLLRRHELLFGFAHAALGGIVAPGRRDARLHLRFFGSGSCYI